MREGKKGTSHTRGKARGAKVQQHEKVLKGGKGTILPGSVPELAHALKAGGVQTNAAKGRTQGHSDSHRSRRRARSSAEREGIARNNPTMQRHREGESEQGGRTWECRCPRRAAEWRHSFGPGTRARQCRGPSA